MLQLYVDGGGPVYPSIWIDPNEVEAVQAMPLLKGCTIYMKSGRTIKIVQEHKMVLDSLGASWVPSVLKEDPPENTTT